MVLREPSTTAPGDSSSLIVAEGSTTPRSLAERFGELPHVEDFRGSGGDASDTSAVQAALTAVAGSDVGPLRFAPQEYEIASTVTFGSHTHLLGVPGQTILKASSGLAQGSTMIRTTVMAGTLDQYLGDETPGYQNQNIDFDGIIFDGNNRTLTTQKEMVALWSIDGLRVRRCVFKNHPYIMVAMAGVRNGHIEASNEFTNWGRPVVGVEGGAAIWCAANPIDKAMCLDCILDGDFHDAEWTSIYAFGKGHEILGWHRNVKEAAIYTRHEDQGFVFQDSVVRPRLIDGVVKKYIAAAGMEIGGDNITIYADNIKNCASSAVDLTNVCDNIMVHVGYIENCCYDMTTTTFVTMGQICVRSVSYTPPDPSGITIMGGRIRDTQSPKKAPAGIKILEDASAEALPIDNVTIIGVDVQDSCVLPANAIKWDAGAKGVNWVIRDNIGFEMPSETWTPTYSASTGTLGTVTTNSARFTRESGRVDFSLTLTVVANGTGNGVFRFTLPSVPLYHGAATGIRASTATGLTLGITAGSATVDVALASATYPATDGAVFKMSGTYFES